MITDVFAGEFKKRQYTPIYKVEVCNTPYTTNSDGIGYKVYPNLTFATATVDGRVPMIAEYSGTGSPIALGTVQPYSMQFDGYFMPPENAKYNFYLAGSGDVKLYIDTNLSGSLGTEQFLCGPTDEGGSLGFKRLNRDDSNYTYITSGTTSAVNQGITMSSKGAYQFRLQFKKTDNRSGVTCLFANDNQYGEPLPVSAGVMSSAGTLKTWYTVSGVTSVNLSESGNSIDQLKFNVPIGQATFDGGGYHTYDEANNRWRWHNDSTHYMQFQHLIRLSIGYTISGTDTYVQRFVGNINDMQVTRTAQGSSLNVVVNSFLDRLKNTMLINQPNPLAYWLSGYMGQGTIATPPAGDQKPVAFDRWRLDKTVKVISLLSGIDSTLVSRSGAASRMSGALAWDGPVLV